MEGRLETKMSKIDGIDPSSLASICDAIIEDAKSDAPVPKQTSYDNLSNLFGYKTVAQDVMADKYKPALKRSGQRDIEYSVMPLTTVIICN